MEEIWKPIPGYEGLYEASTLGNIRNAISGRVLRQSNHWQGYKLVGLHKDKKLKTHTVHRLIAKAFIENPNGYSEVNHKDENKANNNVENLEWCTTKYNNTYGNKIKRGELHPMSKLDSRQVKEIREKRNSGETIVQIADQFGISRSHVCGIVNNRFWRANE